MDRRRFLRLGLAAAAGLWGLRPGPVRALGGGRGVVVVGAGIAGLAAARELAQREIRATVVDARPRLGGRIWTDHSLRAPVDLGASWFEGAGANPIAELARTHEVPTATTELADLALYDADGSPVAATRAEEIRRDFEELSGRLEALGGTLDEEISAGEGVRRVLAGEALDPAARRALDFALATLVVPAAAELDRLSLRGLDEGERLGGGNALFPRGYDRIVRALAEPLDVRLANPVRRIVVRATGLRVETYREALEADAVIVTVPLGVLRSESIAFDPELPARKRAALERLGMGVANKVALRFEIPFWPREPHFFGYMSERPGEFPRFLNLRHHGAMPVLVAFAEGDFARALESRPDHEIQDRVMAVLRTLFGSAIPAPSGMVVTRWGSDPYAGGAHSRLAVGAAPEDRELLAEPLFGGRLLFAGEATHRRYPASVHGAYLSGLREARRVADSR